MSILYTELLGAVVGHLEIDATDASRFEFDANIATAQLGLLNALPFKFLKNAVTTTKTNIDDGIHLYQWPSDFVRFHELWLSYDAAINEAAGVYGNKAQEYDGEQAHIKNIASLATKRYPYIDIDVEGGYGIYPVPSADQATGQRIRYIWQIPNPTITQDCLLEYNLRNLLIFRATQLCALVDEFNIQLAQEMGKNYTEELNLFLPKKGKK